MKTLRSLAHGLGSALAEPRLPLALWAWSAILTLPVAAPIWHVWRDTTADAPRADALMNGFNLATFRELTKFDVTSSWTPAFAALGGVILLAIVGQALVAGGTLEVLVTDERGPFTRRFLAGAGGYFWRFLRVLVVAAVAAGLTLAAVVLAFVPLLAITNDSAWEPGWYLVQAARVVALAVVALLWLIAVDYARIRMALERDRRSALAALARGVATVVRHPLRAFGIWIAGGVLVALLAGAYNLFGGWTAGALFLMIAAQQLFMLVRAGIRVAVVGAEIHASRQLMAAAAAPPPSPVPEPPPAPEPELL